MQQLFKIEALSDIVTPNELIKSGFLGGSRTAIYNFFHNESVPTFRIGRKMYISKEKLKQWLDDQTSLGK